MIFVDANYFLRAMVQPQTTKDRVMGHQAAELFNSVQQGERKITTSEATVAEVVFILTSRRHYGLSRADGVSRLKPILALRHCRMPAKAVSLRALDLFASSVKI